MEHYVGLDVSLKLTAICIVDRTGKIEREGVVPSDPEAIATFVKAHAPHVTRIGLETGATATWLWTELNRLGLPVICIDARHAKAVLKMQINGPQNYATVSKTPHSHSIINGSANYMILQVCLRRRKFHTVIFAVLRQFKAGPTT